MFVLSFASWLGSLLADKWPYRHFKLLCLTSLVWRCSAPFKLLNFKFFAWISTATFVLLLLQFTFFNLSCGTLATDFSLAGIQVMEKPFCHGKTLTSWKLFCRRGKTLDLILFLNGTAEYLANCITSTFLILIITATLILLSLCNLLLQPATLYSGIFNYQNVQLFTHKCLSSILQADLEVF